MFERLWLCRRVQPGTDLDRVHYRVALAIQDLCRSDPPRPSGISCGENAHRMNKLTTRIEAIDFVKGALVLLMVAYHALNYLRYDTLPHTYLSFLPASFITITGYLVSKLNARKQDRTIPDIAFRLVTRAAKLLLIFTVLNVGARLVWTRTHYGAQIGVWDFFNQWFKVYITADAPSVAFDILVPIAYTLLLSVPILAVQRLMPAFAGMIAGISVVFCVTIDCLGIPITNTFLISAGLVGMWLGTIEMEQVDKVANSYGLLVALVAIDLCLKVLQFDNFAAQLYVTLVSLLILYSVGCALNPKWLWFQQVSLLGRYSLLGYITQMLFLQGARAFEGASLGTPVAKPVALIFMVSTLMWLTIVLVDLGRRKFLRIDRLYRAVFA